MIVVLTHLLTFALLLAALTAFFLVVQKPLFLLCNRRKHRLSAAQVLGVYRHGLQLDVATASLLALPVVVLLALHAVGVPACREVIAGYLVLVALLSALGSLADAVLYGFWDSKLDATVLMYLNSPDKFSSVSRLFLAASVAAFLVVAGVMSALLLLSLWFLRSPAGAQWWVGALTALLLLLAGVAVYLYLIWGGMRRHGKKAVKPNSPAKAFFSSEIFCNHAALNPVYNFIYTLSYRRGLDREFRFMDDSCAADVYRECFLDNGVSSSAPTGARSVLRVERPDILLVILESYSMQMVSELRAAGYEPALARWEDEGIRFDRCYCSSIRTDRALVSIESGYPAQPTYSVIKVSPKIATLPGVAKTLRSYGYDTQVVHGGDLRIFNKYEYYQLCGHDRLVDINDFEPSERQQRWGVPDHLVMERVAADIVGRARKGQRQPWMMTLQTLSSHLPFDVPSRLLDDRILNGFAYTDRSLHQLLTTLKASPAWDRLLVVCMADHGYPYKGVSSEQVPFAHIPWLMLGGAVREPLAVSQIVSQTDLPATLLSMLGMPHEEFLFSRDVFSEAYRYPCAFNTYSNGMMFRDEGGCTVFDNSLDHVLDGPDARREHRAKAILQYLYSDLSRR